MRSGRSAGGRANASSRAARVLGRPASTAPAVGQGGQSSVELLGALPVLIVLGLFLFQLLAVGYATVLAANAAEAGAISHAGGGDAQEAARAALPGWSRANMRVGVDGGRVEVSLQAPSPLAVLRDRFEVESAAVVRRPR